MSTDGAGHGGHGGLGSDLGHSPGMDNADLGVGHGGVGHAGHGHHSGGHHGGINHDGKVTVEALMMAYSHSGAPGFSSFGHVDVGSSAHSGMPDHGHLGGWSTGDGLDPNRPLLKSNEAFLKAVEEAKNDPQRRVYGLHVVSHGFVDVPRVFTDLAPRLGAFRVCGTTGNFQPTDVCLNDITDWSKLSTPFTRKRPPAGWYPKAPGLTHVFRQYWQVKPERHWWKRPKGRPTYDRGQSTYMEVNIVTWYFAAIGDYETRVDIKVVSLPVLEQYDKTWAIRGTPLKKHQCVAQGVIDGLFDVLKFTQPTPWAKERRAKLVKLQTTKPAAVDKSGADLDSLFATDGDSTESAAETTAAAPQTAPPKADPAAEAKAEVIITPASQAPKPTGKEVAVHVKIPPPILRNST